MARLLDRYRSLRERFGTIVPSNYDISDRCNLACEGCLYFEGDDRLAHADDGLDAEWERLFAREAARGVNFVYLAGAEPTLEMARIRAAHAHIPRGTVFTNGTRRIPAEIGYRIHISLWGAPRENARLRGADNAAKALRNYAGDPRAVFVYTISRSNIGDIHEAARLVREAGGILTFSYFSPTTQYRAKRAAGSPPGEWFRLAAGGETAMLDRADFARAGAEIARAMNAFGDTIVYSMAYDRFITGPLPHHLDPSGVALDCGHRLTAMHHHIAADRTRSDGKCCSPNIDCAHCRAYAQGYATYLKGFRRMRLDPAAFEEWLSVWELWSKLFLSADKPMRAPVRCAEGATG
jgi:hypothetical protein